MNIGCVHTVSEFEPGPRPLATPKQIPFGLAYIATTLQENGFMVSVLVIPAIGSLKRKIESFINEFNPSLLCFSPVFSQFEIVCRVARHARQCDEHLKTIAGGPHISLNPEQSIATLNFDAICIGEGERAVLGYARQMEQGREPSGIPNLWIKKGNNEIEHNPPEPFEQDLDRLPFIDRSLWAGHVHDACASPAVLIGRGCPFTCTYCSNHRLKTVAPGRYVRFRSPENIVAEIEGMTAGDTCVREIYLEIETLGARIDYALELAAALERFNAGREKAVSFGVNLAPTKPVVDRMEELLSAFQRARITFINIGLESGNERIRNTVLKRPRYTNEDLIRFARCAREKNGIAVRLYVLIGIPGEKRKDFFETVACARACRPQTCFLSIFTPYPGTELYERAQASNVLKKWSARGGRERIHPSIKTPGYPGWLILLDYFLFFFYINTGHVPFSKTVFYSLRRMMKSFPRVEQIYKTLSRK